jgi:pimeloyl-ACP methyl ester carboxylesterase
MVVGLGEYPERTSAAETHVERAGVRLAAVAAGDGVPIALLHGLTATRRYVVMGSRSLERSGHHVIGYDARGHGSSSPAPSPDAYTYEDLDLDLEAVLDRFGVERAVLAGVSMGAHTAIRLALRAPPRVAGLVVITPGYDPATHDDPARLSRWDALADGLEHGGVEGFVQAYGDPGVAPRWREATVKAIRQRLELHEHPGAVADALRCVPRSRPFGGLEQLSALSMPVTVVASGDTADPGHPQALAAAYAEAIPGAVLITDEPGKSPLAWQGSQISDVIAGAAARSA